MRGAFNVRFKHASTLEPWGNDWRSHISAEIYGRNFATSPALYVSELLKWTNCSLKMWSWALRKRNRFIALDDGNKSLGLRHRNTHLQTDMTTGDLTFSTTLRDITIIIQTKRTVSWIFSKNVFFCHPFSLSLLFVWHGDEIPCLSKAINTHIPSEYIDQNHSCLIWI